MVTIPFQTTNQLTYKNGALPGGAQEQPLVVMKQREGALALGATGGGGGGGRGWRPGGRPVGQRGGEDRVQGLQIGAEGPRVHREHGVRQHEEGVARPRVVLPRGACGGRRAPGEDILQLEGEPSRPRWPGHGLSSRGPAAGARGLRPPEHAQRASWGHA